MEGRRGGEGEKKGEGENRGKRGSVRKPR